jgi:hypothetical protein
MPVPVRTTIVISALAAACAPTSSDGPELVATPLAARPAEPGPRFERLSAEASGIALENPFDWEHPLRRLYPHGFCGGGVSVGDIDGDGLPEVFLTSQTGADRLYRNLGGMVFEDVSAAAGVDGREWSAGSSFGDVDGDGDLDLYVCSYDAPNRLYVNCGDGTFLEEAGARGVAFRGASIMGAFADYDLDGDLDLYLVTNRLYPGAAADFPRTHHVNGRVAIAPGFEEAFAIQERLIDGERQKFVVKAGQRDRLFRNEGDGSFVDVSAAAGIDGRHPGLSATWWDCDDDGLPDLYVSNDFWDADRLYRNQGDGTFVDEIRARAPQTPWFSMGADAGDLDGDGRIDLLAADMSARTHFMSKIMMGGMEDSRWFLESAEPRQMMRNTLLLGSGTERLLEAGFLSGLASTDWTWSVKLGDLDLDGQLDAFFTNGTANHSFDPDFARVLQEFSEEQSRTGVVDPEVRAAEQWRLYRQLDVRRERDLAFRGRGDLRFDDVSSPWGLDKLSVSFGAALADLDRDGDLDLVVNHVGEPVSVYRNRSAGAHALLVRLVGRASERNGVGAAIEVETASARQVRRLFTAAGYMSANEPLAHFGLGEAETLERLTVRWPSGHVQAFEGLAADQLYTVTEPRGPAGGDPVERARSEARPTGSGPSGPRLTEVGLAHGLDRRVSEPAFDDYAVQPLLPAKLSRQGPGLAWGDADGDGDDDLFVGGPAGVPGQLLRRADSGFEAVAGPWSEDAASEDTGALWLDADSDGDLDLIVASGGVEHTPGDPALRDRLYLSDGTGGFRRAPLDALGATAEASGALAAGDLDGDGDLDLFVGARSVPGRYPLVPNSRLLLNDGGRFEDVTAERAAGLARVGLVTGALWSDADLDGRADLFVTNEWGPVAFWRNTGGRLVDGTVAAGLSERTGWWNGVTAGDLDGDGDQDYVVANAGLNTKYTASSEKPLALFFGDFEGAGGENLIEAKSGQDELLPVRGLSCSAGAMPSVGERMPTYRDFASASLDEIYPGGVLEAALRLEVTELASGVLMNESADGALRFAWRPLPRRAQISPTQGSVVTDLDGDGHADLACAQNFYWREPETGRWNGGLGAVLSGDGTGALRWMDAAESGFVVPGDARALTVCDLDGDAAPDLVVARNDERLLAFTHANAGAEGRLAVRLKGPPGNPSCVGARVTVGGRAIELAAGSGVLSQSGPVVFFGAGTEVHVTWPSGEQSTHAARAGGGRLELTHP